MRRRGNSYGCAFLVALSDEDIARAFKGQESVLADLSSKLEARFRLAEEERERRGESQIARLMRWLGC